MRSITFFQITLYITFLLPAGIFAQQNTFSSVFYNPTYGSSAQAYSVAETEDSAFIIVGYRDEDALIMKMDHTGQKIWDKRFDFGFNYPILYRIIPTYDNAFAIAGSGGSNKLCMKITIDGDILWTRSIDFGHNEYVTNIGESSDKGLILCGYGSTGVGYNTHMLVMKLDSSGMLQWATTLATGAVNNEAHSIRQTEDGGYILIGWYGGSNVTSIFASLIRLSSQGEIIWSKRLQTDPAEGSYGYDAIESGEGYFCYATSYYSDVLTIGTDDLGNVLRATKMDGSGWSAGLNQSLGPKLSSSADGNIVLVTMGQWGGSLFKVNPMGIGIWEKELILEVVDVIESKDLGYLVVGNGPIWGVSIPYPYNLQIGMIKTDSAGNGSGCSWNSNVTTDTITATFDSIELDTTWGAAIESLQITISDSNLLYLPGCVEVVPSIEENPSRSENLIISPNPSDGIILINIESNGKKLSIIEIYNNAGKRVYSSDAKHKLPVQLDLSSFTDGIYYIQAISNKKRFSQKIMIIH